MKTAGIIAEYNPFHNGHSLHIEKTRRILGADTAIVCVMSGNFVQRGEPAAFDKHVRAKAAVLCGADLVLELPCVYSLASAERFAGAGVAMLAKLGCVDYISFGSESGDVAALQNMAELLESEEFRSELVLQARKGVSFAAARQLAAEKLTGRDCSLLSKPNDILAIEYLKALKSQSCAIKPLAVLRAGAAHDGAEPVCKTASASFIRERIHGEGILYGEFMPREAAALFSAEIAAGRCVSVINYGQSIMTRLRMASEADFALLPDMSEGLNNRLAAAARSCASLEELYGAVKTKRYALSRIRRAVMCAWLGIGKDDVPPSPPYLRVLAANERGRALLHSARDSAPIITKPASSKKLDAAAAGLFTLEARASDIYALGFEREADRAGGREWLTSPVML